MFRTLFCSNQAPPQILVQILVCRDNSETVRYSKNDINIIYTVTASNNIVECYIISGCIVYYHTRQYIVYYHARHYIVCYYIRHYMVYYHIRHYMVYYHIRHYIVCYYIRHYMVYYHIRHYIIVFATFDLI